MKTKTYLAKLVVTIGEYENSVSLLIAAESEAAAVEEHRRAAASYYGDEDSQPDEDGVFWANYGQVAVKPGALVEIGTSTFLDLQSSMLVRKSPRCAAPSLDDLEDVKKASQALGRALERSGAEVSHAQLLNAIAQAWGEGNWNKLRLKLGQPVAADAASPRLPEDVLRAAREVCNQASSEGCDEDLTVTSSDAVKALEEAIRRFQGQPTSDFIREDKVFDVVDDVRERAQQSEFRITSAANARELVENSSDLLNLNLTEAELKEAIRRLYG